MERRSSRFEVNNFIGCENKGMNHIHDRQKEEKTRAEQRYIRDMARYYQQQQKNELERDIQRIEEQLLIAKQICRENVSDDRD